MCYFVLVMDTTWASGDPVKLGESSMVGMWLMLFFITAVSTHTYTYIVRPALFCSKIISVRGLITVLCEPRVEGFPPVISHV